MKRIISKPVISILCCMIMFSCTNKKSKPKTSFEANKEKTEHLASVLGVSYDIPEFSTTYLFQKWIDEHKSFLFSEYEISDIYKKDSIYILEIQPYFVPDMIIDLTCSKDQIDYLIGKNLDYDDLFFEPNVYLVAELNTVHKIRYCIASEIVDMMHKDDNDNYVNYQDVELRLDIPDSFHLSGKLVEIKSK